MNLMMFVFSLFLNVVFLDEFRSNICSEKAMMLYIITEKQVIFIYYLHYSLSFMH